MGSRMRRSQTGNRAFQRAGRTWIARLCVLGAAFAAGPLLAASASASEPGHFPEYARCVKTEALGRRYSGKYTEKACLTKATPTEIQEAKKNRYELEGVSSGVFEGASKKGATILTDGVKGAAESVLCTKAVDRGTFESAVYATYEILFEGCVGNGEKKTDPCGNKAGPENIETEPLYSTLVWLNRGESEPGLLLEPESEQVAEFKCGAEKVDLDGYVVGAIENTKKGHTVTFALAGGQQAHRSIWVFGSEVRSLNLYTLSGTKHVESTLETVETQGGTGVY